MSQSRAQSALETAANITFGYGINFAANLTILPMFGYHVTVRDNITIGLIYTVISIARSYLLRRGFNALHVRQSKGNLS